MQHKALTREEVISVIEGKSTAHRVPIFAHRWVHPSEFGDREAQVHEILAKYPEDARNIWLQMPANYNAPDDDPNYRWMNFDDPYAGKSVGIDEQIAITDWDQLDDILANFPDPNYAGMTANARTLEGTLDDDGRYRVANFFFFFFERHWSFRGMTNALMDYYTNPDEVHKLFRALTDFYLVVLERSKNELQADAFLTSDDLGTQTGPFISPEIFKTFFKPYYKELIDKAHELGLHFWLHSCGNIDLLLPDLIEIGLDVLHPIQKGPMDQAETAEKYAGQISFWAGLEVQQVIPWGTPDEVRQEVRHIIDSVWQPNKGNMVLTFGNGVNGDCTLESLEAFMDEAYNYGTKKLAE